MGDILTVQLSETFSSTKSITSQTAKEDAIGAEVGPTGILRNFAGMSFYIVFNMIGNTNQTHLIQPIHIKKS